MSSIHISKDLNLGKSNTLVSKVKRRSSKELMLWIKVATMAILALNGKNYGTGNKLNLEIAWQIILKQWRYFKTTDSFV